MQNYILKSKKDESPGTVSFKFVDENGKVPQFIPGQYINIYFPETGSQEGKAYSIASCTDEKTFTITVKAMGVFSNKIHALKVGDKVVGSLPYGFFYSEDKTKDLVLIAGGIGVTPFRSMIKEVFTKTNTKKTKQKIFLFHSARTKDDLLFHGEFKKIQKNNPDFVANFFVTREKVRGVNSRRMSVEDILPNVKNIKNTDFLICGSIGFVRDMWIGLKKSGMDADQILTEAFF